MPQDDDFLLRGALRRVQVIPRNIQVDGPEDDRGDVPEIGNEDVQPPVQDSERIQQARGEATQARGGISIDVDAEARDWIKVVRDGGGGLMIGPEDGIIAVPEGASERAEKEPVEEETPVDDAPKSIDDVSALGKEALTQTFEEEDEDVEGAIQKTMFAIRQFMAGIEKSLFDRRKHD